MPEKYSQLVRAIIAGWCLFFGGYFINAATNTVRYGVDVWETKEGNKDTVRYGVDVWETKEGNKEGLPQKSVITMVQTRDGYLWLGTLNGLVRFDGSRFTVFDESNTPKLNSSRIVKLFEDSKTNLWIGTETAGAAVVKEGKVIPLAFGQGRREGMLMSVCEDALGAVWLYTKDGELGRYLDGKMDVWSFPAHRFNRCRALIAEKSGLVWVGQDQSLFALNPKAVRSTVSLVEEQVVPVAKLDLLLASKTGGHWRLVDGSVQKWVDHRLSSKWSYPWPNGTFVNAACEDEEGNLVVGTSGQGLFWFDAEGKATHITKNEGLSSYNSILSLHADNEGSLWVGLDGGGLNRLKRQVFKPLEISRGLTVQSVLEDKEGGLWFSSNDQGIDHWKDGALKHMGFSVGPINLYVRSLLLDSKDMLWAGSVVGGLLRLVGDTFQPAPGAERLNREVSALHQDRRGVLWIGTQGGLARWDEHEWKLYTTNDGLSVNIVRAIADDAEGNLWIGTEGGGLNRLRDGKFGSWQQKDGFPSDNISSLYLDGDGVLWVGTFGSGLVRFRDGKWTHYTTREGLISNGIDYLIEDDQGCLWIGSNTGVMRVRKKELNDFARGARSFVPCRGFGERDGLPASECTLGSQPAACHAKDGSLWFPTIAGLASVDPTQFRSNTNPPPVLIESVLIEGQEQNAGGLNGKFPQSVTVPAGKEHLDIQYTSLHFSSPTSPRFKYRLEGHEANWIEVGDRRVASYPKLPPGHYHFQVTACNEDGVWNEMGSSIGVIVLPPFWRTWWFLTLTTLLLLGMVVAIVHFISTQKLQRQLEGLRQQQALEKERARIARDIHDQVGASLTQVSLLGEMVESDKDLPEEVEAHARQITQAARETSHALDEIVWTVNPSNDTLDGLINYVCKHAQEYLSVAGLRYRLEIPAQLPRKTISPEARHNTFLAAKEAVTNIVKHARASEVWIRLNVEPNRFTLHIEDNGQGPVGINEKAAQSRNGLSNMRKRMEDIGGRFFIGARPEGGTLVSFTVPLGKN